MIVSHLHTLPESYPTTSFRPQAPQLSLTPTFQVDTYFHIREKSQYLSLESGSSRSSVPPVPEYLIPFLAPTGISMYVVQRHTGTHTHKINKVCADFKWITSGLVSLLSSL